MVTSIGPLAVATRRVKRVASAVEEGSVVVSDVHKFLAKGEDEG